MKNALAILAVVAGVVLGLYVGGWLFFVGGILGLVAVVNGLIEGSGLDGMLIVWSILKIMFAGLVGYLSALVVVVPAMGVLGATKRNKLKK